MEKDKLLPIGTPVFDVRHGWGKVVEIQKCVTYLLVCHFKEEKEVEAYTKEGRHLEYHKHPMLSLTEYTLEKGGFTSITEFDHDAPKVGDWGYFWDEDAEHCVLGRLKIINKEEKHPYYLTSIAGFSYFSKEIPEHIKKLQENG